MKHLSRDEMKKVMGGYAPLEPVCRLVHTVNGNSSISYMNFSSSTACSSQSSGANAGCVSLIGSGGGSCGYDCQCDGWGV
jgi:hypothetical protein